jgi:hypothetical protein
MSKVKDMSKFRQFLLKCDHHLLHSSPYVACGYFGYAYHECSTNGSNHPTNRVGNFVKNVSLSGLFALTGFIWPLSLPIYCYMANREKSFLVEAVE